MKKQFNHTATNILFSRNTLFIISLSHQVSEAVEMIGGSNESLGGLIDASSSSLCCSVLEEDRVTERYYLDDSFASWPSSRRLRTNININI